VVISAEGATGVQLRSVDLAGNISAWSATADVRLDRLAPSVPTPAGGSSNWTSGPVAVSATGSR
jgi:hypothetical protein